MWMRRLTECKESDMADIVSLTQERDQLRAEVERLRRVEADAAALRLAFERAAQAYFTAMNGKPRQHWADEPWAVWNNLYEAVRDNQAGLSLLAELEMGKRDRA